MKDKDKLLVQDVLAEKYSFHNLSDIDSPLLCMRDDLTIRELKEDHREMVDAISNGELELGVNYSIAYSFLRDNGISPPFVIFSFWLGILLFPVGVVSLFLGKVILAIILILSGFFISGLSYFLIGKVNLRNKIRGLILTDYEICYMLLCKRAINIREPRREN